MRIGTAEIYAQVERIPEVLEALAIGQDLDNDVRVVLFVRLARGVGLDDRLMPGSRSRCAMAPRPAMCPL